MNEFTKGDGNRMGLAATDPTLNDWLDDLVRTGALADGITSSRHHPLQGRVRGRRLPR
jgi:hypothetical protein